MLHIRRRLIAAAAAVALLVGALVTVALAQRTDSAVADGASAAAATLTEGLPAVAATELRSIARAGTRVEDSQLAVSTGGRSLWLTPTREGVCHSLVGPDGATASCDPDDRVAANAAPPATAFSGCAFAEAPDASVGTPDDTPIRCEAVTVYGIVSERIDDVTLEVGHGEAPPVAFANGAYIVSVPLEQAPATIRLTGDGVAASYPIDVSGFGG